MAASQSNADEKTRDVDLRTALHQTVLIEHRSDPDTLIVDELGIWYGTARIDIAVVNGSIHGYEIKSDYDTLDRLAAQASAYGRVLDSVTLVVGLCHLKSALKLIPKWWGITIASRTNGVVTFTEYRRPKNNPKPDALAVAAMLWCEELIDELQARSAAKGVRGKSRAIMAARLASVMTIEELRATVRRRLKSRQDWRAAARQT